MIRGTVKVTGGKRPGPRTSALLGIQEVERERLLAGEAIVVVLPAFRTFDEVVLVLTGSGALDAVERAVKQDEATTVRIDYDTKEGHGG